MKMRYVLISSLLSGIVIIAGLFAYNQYFTYKIRDNQKSILFDNTLIPGDIDYITSIIDKINPGYLEEYKEIHFTRDTSLTMGHSSIGSQYNGKIIIVLQDGIDLRDVICHELLHTLIVVDNDPRYPVEELIIQDILKKNKVCYIEESPEPKVLALKEREKD